LCLTACVSVIRPTLKIGLVAPYEGRYRDIGYDVIYAVRLAVREANGAGGVAGYSVEVVSLDDSGDAQMAVEQARKMATDPQVLAVIGDWLDATTVAAAPEYEMTGLPFIATTSSPDLPAAAFRLWLTKSSLTMAIPDALHCPAPCDTLENLDWLKSAIRHQPSAISGPPLWGQPQFAKLAEDAAEGVYVIAPAPMPADSADPTFIERYRAVSNGIEPRFNAVLAYDAARLLFAAIEHDVRANRTPTRAGVAAALSQIEFDGLSGAIRFDSDHNWAEARGWAYQWREGELVRP
jgi:ABC-type branched-subunit amino acid transport system substrate-binding protein